MSRASKQRRRAIAGILVLGAALFADESASSNLTLDSVQQRGYEVTYEQIADLYGGPISKYPIFSVKAHPELMWVRPDMGIGMVANPFAFGMGHPPRLPSWRAVTRSLSKGYMPIIISRWSDAALSYEQIAFAALVDGGEVRTGHEKQVALVRLKVQNADPSTDRHATFWAFIPARVAMKGGLLEPVVPDGTYALLDVTGSLPPVPPDLATAVGDVLRSRGALLGIHKEDPEIRTRAADGALRFDVDLAPGRKRSVYFAISSHRQGLSMEDLERLRGVDFSSALERRKLDLDRILNRGMKIDVPEEVVNNIYRAQILYNQPAMVQAADRDYYMPVQGYQGGWPWEEAKMLLGLDALGYHEDVRKSLGYFLRLQGKFAPHGQIRSSEGAFGHPGTFDESGWEHEDSTIYGLLAAPRAGKKWMSWMNGTGSVLYAFAEHYFYSKDRNWLEEVAPAVVRACDWIIRERQRTKETDTQNRRVLQFGLLPAGEAYDPHPTEPTKFDYYVAFTDGYSCQGLTRAAEALADIGHPDAARLRREAHSYREDILEVLRRTRRGDLALPPYPERLYQPDGWASFATGALALVDTGLLDVSDPAFDQLENYTKKNFSLLGLTGRVYVDPIIQPSYYVVISEEIYHRAWLLRGEVPKALLTFYSILGFAVDKETLGSVERFCPRDRRYAPYFMDGSASSRICSMIRNTVFLEDGGVLYVLPGAPRRWLDPGKVIEVRRAPTYFGSLGFRIESRIDGREIQAELSLSLNRPERLNAIRLRLPHPDRERMTSVSVNGRRWTRFEPGRELIELPPGGKQYRIAAHF